MAFLDVAAKALPHKGETTMPPFDAEAEADKIEKLAKESFHDNWKESRAKLLDEWLLLDKEQRNAVASELERKYDNHDFSAWPVPTIVRNAEDAAGIEFRKSAWDFVWPWDDNPDDPFKIISDGEPGQEQIGVRYVADGIDPPPAYCASRNIEGRTILLGRGEETSVTSGDPGLTIVHLESGKILRCESEAWPDK